MKRGISLLIGLYCAFLTFSLMTYVWGENGIVAYAELSAYKERLESNVEQLREVKNSLAEKADRLQSSADTLALSARDLGYYRDNERIIYVEGYDASENLYIVGELLRPFRREPVNPLVFRIFAVVVGAVGYIVSRYASWREQ